MSYFPYRIGAANDPRIVALMGAYGVAGYGYYFITIDMMYQMNRGMIDTKSKAIVGSIAHKLGMSLDEYFEFVDLAAEVRLFDPKLWQEERIICSHGVSEKVKSWKEAIEKMSEGGKKSVEVRRAKAQERKAQGENKIQI